VVWSYSPCERWFLRDPFVVGHEGRREAMLSVKEVRRR
jgi:hypothetical protein